MGTKRIFNKTVMHFSFQASKNKISGSSLIFEKLQMVSVGRSLVCLVFTSGDNRLVSVQCEVFAKQQQKSILSILYN